MQFARFLACALAPFLAVATAGSGLHPLDVASIAATDRALLAAKAEPNTLGCSVSPVTPRMGLDLRFRAGYTVSIPLRRLMQTGGAVRAVLLVTPLSSNGRAAAFSKETPTPPIEAGAKGNAELTGEYAVGPGRYRADMLLSYADAVCVRHWEVEAKLDKSLAGMPLPLGPGAVEAAPENPFAERSSPPARSARSVRVKVLVNFSPALEGELLTDNDIRGLTAILRAVTRESRFGQFSVVAFSSEQQEVLLRQPAAAKIDFGALGRAVRGLRSGTVSLRQISDPKSGAAFLTDLLAAELGAESPTPDAVVVISPKVYLDGNISERELAASAHVACPVFLLSYTRNPAANPWEGALSRAIKKVYSGAEFIVASPRDLSRAFERLRSNLQSQR